MNADGQQPKNNILLFQTEAGLIFFIFEVWVGKEHSRVDAIH